MESTARALTAYPNLRGWAERTADALRRRWPEADRDFGRLPMYTRR